MIGTRRSIALAVLLAVVPAPTSEAQEVGIRAGATFATMAVDSDLPASTRPAAAAQTLFVGGASVFVTRSGRGGVQVEALIHQKGARRLFLEGDPDDTLTITYLEVPLLLHVDALQQGDSSVYIVAGPSVAVSLRERYSSYRGTSDVGELVKKVDAGFSVGGGLEAGPLIVDARYTWGLRDALSLGPTTLRHRTFAVTAGVRLR